MKLILGILATILCPAQSVMHFNPLSPGGSMQFTTFTIANSGSNFQITPPTGSATTVAKAAALTQSLTLFTPPARFYVLGCITTLSTPFVGTTTLTATVGITGSLTACIPSGLNLMASTGTAVAPLIVAPIFSTNGTDSVILALTATVSNLSSISAGSVKVTIVYGVAP